MPRQPMKKAKPLFKIGVISSPKLKDQAAIRTVVEELGECNIVVDTDKGPSMIAFKEALRRGYPQPRVLGTEKIVAACDGLVFFLTEDSPKRVQKALMRAQQVERPLILVEESAKGIMVSKLNWE